MNEILKFTDRDEFRAWLNEHCLSGDGVWLLFGKTEEVKTITALQALEEALCFGWIDGQMKSIDDKTYKKYFSPRRAKSKWSDKNKTIVRDLEKRGLMTEFGREKIKEAMGDAKITLDSDTYLVFESGGGEYTFNFDEGSETVKRIRVNDGTEKEYSID